jgi:hypothetical protein
MYEQRSAEDHTESSTPSWEMRSWPPTRRQLELLLFRAACVVAAVLLGVLPAYYVAQQWNSTNVHNVQITPIPNATNFPPTSPPSPDREPIGQNPDCWIEDPGWPHDCLSLP